jgi:hypothetical protein
VVGYEDDGLTEVGVEEVPVCDQQMSPQAVHASMIPSALLNPRASALPSRS